MEEKRLLGITIIGRIQLVLGILGTIFLIWVILASLACLFFAEGEAQMGGLAIVLAPWFAPFPILWILGAGILKLRSWARKMQIIIWSLAAAIGVLFSLLGVLWLLIPTFVSAWFIWFFTRPQVKQQFT